jgi:hypothetical protein
MGISERCHTRRCQNQTDREAQHRSRWYSSIAPGDFRDGSGAIHKTIFTEPGASRLRHLKSLSISFCQMDNHTLSYHFVATIFGRLHWPMSFRRTYAGFSREERANVRPNGPRLQLCWTRQFSPAARNLEHRAWAASRVAAATRTRLQIGAGLILAVVRTMTGS